MEDEMLGGAADVEESPVQAVVGAGVLVDRQRGLGPRDYFEVFGDQFEATEFDDGVVHDPTGDLDCRLHRQAF